MPVAARGFGVLIAEDNRDLRAALCAIIGAEPDMHVAGTAARVEELVDAMRTCPARVLVLDLDLGGQSSVPALETLRAQHPHLAAVIFSGGTPDALASVAARLGRCECVVKTGDVTPLLDAIRRGAQGTLQDPGSGAAGAG